MGFLDLLRTNRNYRYTWMGQVISEIGDNFNTVAVFALAMEGRTSALVVTGVMLARAIPMLVAGPFAGVVLDRMDRRKVMLASDLVRSVIALGFILAYYWHSNVLLYLLSGLLMLASPFFTAGRSAILPSITKPNELLTANSLTQTTGWTTTAIGAMLGGWSTARFGYDVAFLFNALSFLGSAACIAALCSPKGHFRAECADSAPARRSPLREYAAGLRFIADRPVLVAIAITNIGWATGGGAAQILFSLFGKVVFQRGAEGIGTIWGCAGVGLVIGGLVGHRIGKRITFQGYTRAAVVCYFLHGASYVVFSQMQSFAWACFFIGLSRATVAVCSVLNYAQVVRQSHDAYRGRVFATLETLTWAVMMLSMLGAGLASERFHPRTIGLVAGCLSSLTALWWILLIRSGKLQQVPTTMPIGRAA